MLGRQLVPPAEATDGEQLLPVKENVCSADPGDLVAYRLALTHQLLFQVKWVGRVIDVLAMPGDRVLVELFWNDRPVPQLDALLVWPHIVEVIQACGRGPDKPTLLP